MDRDEPGRDYARAAEAELTELAIRLEAIRSRFDQGHDSGALAAELVETVDAIRDARDRIDEQASSVDAQIAAERIRCYELFDLAPDAYLVTDGMGVIREANAAATALFARRSAYLIGKPLPVFVVNSDRRVVRAALIRLLSQPRSGAFELRLDTAGRERYVEARADSEQSKQGTTLFRWILRDVTSRKESEAEVLSLNAELERRIDERTRELSEAYARLETVLQQLPEGVLIMNGEGRLELANQRAEELIGLSSEEIASGLRDRTWTFGGAPMLETLRRAFDGAELPFHGRFTYRRPDGEELILEAAARPVRSDRGVTSVVLTFQDVTARELRERAERAFVTNAAHELQTPIAAIASAVEVLQSGAKRRAADRDRFLEHVERSCRRLERLTRALLVLARAQTRAEEPRRELIPVAPLLEAVADGLDSDGTIAIDCDEHLAVLANRPLLEQALENLGANALKHTRGPVVLAGERRNGRVVIHVRDSGTGIPMAERERIFERFYRTGEAVGEGFGLGLAIVSEAVTALDGELELETSPDGTSISIALPAATIVTP